MKRVVIALTAFALVASLVLTGCQKKVEVQTGTRVMCTYGHQISSSVRTIQVPVDKAGSYKVKTVTKVCDKHRKLQSLYDQAQDAIDKGDFTTARSLLEQVVAIDAGFSSADKQLESIKKGGKPKSSRATAPSAPATSTPEPGDGSDTPAQSLVKWAPDALTGFRAGRASIDAFTMSRDYVPDDSGILTLVIVAEQYRDAAAAKAALDRDVRLHYTKQVTSPSINGRTGFSATDGRRYAVYAFTDGSVMVAIEASARSGDPSKLAPVLEAVVRQLP